MGASGSGARRTDKQIVVGALEGLDRDVVVIGRIQLVHPDFTAWPDGHQGVRSP